jgi:hypothetical protein
LLLSPAMAGTQDLGPSHKRIEKRLK